MRTTKAPETVLETAKLSEDRNTDGGEIPHHMYGSPRQGLSRGLLITSIEFQKTSQPHSFHVFNLLDQVTKTFSWGAASMSVGSKQHIHDR